MISLPFNFETSLNLKSRFLRKVRGISKTRQFELRNMTDSKHQATYCFFIEWKKKSFNLI